MSKTVIVQGLEVNELLEQLRAVVREEIKQAATWKQPEEKLLSPAQTVKVFVPAISKSTLHNWTEQGLLQAHYIGSRKFYRLSEILEKAQTLHKYKNVA